MKSQPLDQIRWVSNSPFWLVHVAAVVGVAMVGFSWTGLLLAVTFYFVRMFGITAGYHRYFSHRSFKTNRVVQFLLGLLGTTAAQKGPLWWASHHRNHHKYSDQPEDLHSPRQRGFLYSHVTWTMVKRANVSDWSNIKDLTRYPELVLLDKLNMVPVVGMAVALFLIGGAHALVWGFFVSTVLLWHGTFCVNSLAHIIGRRRYQTTDDSKNSVFVALITMGEGWHNNHHHYQRSVNQGFYWWEVDVTYYVLRAMGLVGLVRDMHITPRHVRDQTAAPGRARLEEQSSEPDTPVTVEAKAA
jgi:stearoyl-CoA desaturase (delta-9 desaturase)